MYIAKEALFPERANALIRICSVARTFLVRMLQNQGHRR